MKYPSYGHHYNISLIVRLLLTPARDDLLTVKLEIVGLDDFE